MNAPYPRFCFVFSELPPICNCLQIGIESVPKSVSKLIRQIWWVLENVSFVCLIWTEIMNTRFQNNKIKNEYLPLLIRERWISSVWMNIHLTFDGSLKDVFSALCKDIQKRLRGRGAELKDEELLLLKFHFILLLVLFCHILLTRECVSESD